MNNKAMDWKIQKCSLEKTLLCLKMDNKIKMQTTIIRKKIHLQQLEQKQIVLKET